jgi:hypothetical protein
MNPELRKTTIINGEDVVLKVNPEIVNLLGSDKWKEVTYPNKSILLGEVYNEANNIKICLIGRYSLAAYYTNTNEFAPVPEKELIRLAMSGKLQNQINLEISEDKYIFDAGVIVNGELTEVIEVYDEANNLDELFDILEGLFAEISTPYQLCGVQF